MERGGHTSGPRGSESRGPGQVANIRTVDLRTADRRVIGTVTVPGDDRARLWKRSVMWACRVADCDHVGEHETEEAATRALWVHVAEDHELELTA